MKKNYTLFSALVLTASMAFAQNVQNPFVNQQATVMPTEGGTPAKAFNTNQKAPGDTLFYEDFGSGGPGGAQLPAGWTTQNNAGNSNNWIWATGAPGGQYSTGMPALASTTGANGFMSLPGDFYNTPAPPGGFIGMDASFTAPVINITPARASVVLQWEQAHRYCCDGAGTLVAEVSSDGINWDAYDARGGRNPNTATPNAEVYSVNVSATLAFQTTAYVRFRQTGSSHYYWMIDDVGLYEGNANNMQLADFAANFIDTFDFNPVMTIIPQCAMVPMNFDGITVNAGSNAQTNVFVKARVDQDSTWAGGPGIGIEYEDSSLVAMSVPSLQRDTTNVSSYVNTSSGYYRAIVSVVSDSVNQDPSDAIGIYSFAVSDTVLARDRGENVFVGGAGPGNYVGGGNDGDRWGVLFTMGQSRTVTSLSMYIANDVSNDGVQLVPKIWSFEQDSATLTGAMSTVVAENLVPTTIDTSMFNTWVSFDFAFGTGPQQLQAGKQYVMGWEQISGATNSLEVMIGRDRTMEPFAPAVTNFVYVNDAAPNWGWVTQVAAIRANFGPYTNLQGQTFPGCLVGVEEEIASQVGFEVSPNPNNGQFNVVVNNETEADYTINVRNMLGQIVYTDLISVNKQMTKQMDLSDFQKGVYFVSLENENERLVKKVVVK